MVDRPQPPLTHQTAPTAFALRNIADRKARGRLRAAATVEAVGRELEWLDAEGWRYQLERPPVVTISPKDTERAAATVDLRVWDATGDLIFRDRIHAWDGFPVLVPDGTQHKETRDDGTTQRVDNFREAPLEAARLDLAHTVRVVTKNGPWVKDKPGTVSTFYSGTTDGYVRKINATYSTARTMASPATAVTSDQAGLNVGQYFAVADGYFCWESFIDFDTSAIPDADDVTVAVLSLDGSQNSSATDFTVEARLYNWGGTLTAGDAVAGADLGTHTLLASWSTAGYSANYNDFTSESAFISNISKTGTTSLILNSSRHRNGDTPTGDEYVVLWDAGRAGTTEDPKLVVTHAPSGATGTGALNVPMQTLSGTGKQTQSGTGSLITPMQTLAGTGVFPFAGLGAFSVPVQTLSGVGLFPFAGVGALIVPVQTLAGSGTYTPAAMTGTGAISIPMQVLAGVGRAPYIGTGALIVPMQELDAVGKQLYAATGQFTVPIQTMEGAGKQLFSGTGAFNIPMLVLTGLGSQAFIGTGTLAVPMQTMAGSGTYTITGTGAFIVPMQELVGVGINVLPPLVLVEFILTIPRYLNTIFVPRYTAELTLPKSYKTLTIEPTETILQIPTPEEVRSIRGN